MEKNLISGMDLRNDGEKGQNLTSGVRFSESARSIFSPRGTDQKSYGKRMDFR